MASLKLTIDTGNAAFDDEMEGSELARILRDLARTVSGRNGGDGAERGNVFDTNGNRVGSYTITRRAKKKERA